MGVAVRLRTRHSQFFCPRQARVSGRAPAQVRKPAPRQFERSVSFKLTRPLLPLKSPPRARHDFRPKLKVFRVSSGSDSGGTHSAMSRSTRHARADGMSGAARYSFREPQNDEDKVENLNPPDLLLAVAAHGWRGARRLGEGIEPKGWRAVLRTEDQPRQGLGQGAQKCTRRQAR